MNSPQSQSNEENERIIIDAVIAGDSDQFDLLVTKYRDRVFRFILKGDGTGSAEDLTQETFLEAYKNLKKFQGRSKFSTWLFGIALNLSRNHYNRSPENQFQTLSMEYFTNLPSNDESLPKILEDKKYMFDLKRQIDALDDPLREVLFLCSIEGLPYAEVAELLQIPEGTVKSRLYTARKTLRTAAG
jgi:RNA polymerase sigma-70 factor (ECF subfamily)